MNASELEKEINKAARALGAIETVLLKKRLELKKAQASYASHDKALRASYENYHYLKSNKCQIVDVLEFRDIVEIIGITESELLLLRVEFVKIKQDIKQLEDSISSQKIMLANLRQEFSEYGKIIRFPKLNHRKSS